MALRIRIYALSEQRRVTVKIYAEELGDHAVRDAGRVGAAARGKRVELRQRTTARRGVSTVGRIGDIQNQSESLRIVANRCELLRIVASRCESLQIGANRSESERIGANRRESEGIGANRSDVRSILALS